MNKLCKLAAIKSTTVRSVEVKIILESSYSLTRRHFTMLGKNIGTKMDARFMSSQYKAYLAQGDKKKTDLVPARAPTKKLKGKAQKRAEMRRKGIFVQADSSEFDNTIMEKPSSRIRPYVLRSINRKLKWKEHLQKIVGAPVSEESSASTSSSNVKFGKKSGKTLESMTESTIEESRKPKKKSKPRRTPEVKEKQPQEQFEEKKELTTRLPPTNWEGFIPSEKVTSVRVAKQTSTTTMLEDIYAPIEEDVDLTRILVDFNAENMAGVGAGDKRFLNAANKILRTAYRDKAFEKTLTKAENDILAKFFSGKIPYDAHVLHTLDTVLDKTIDYFRQHRTKISPEVEEIIAKREALKAAMLETMLTVPRFLPSEWVKQFEVYQQEALRETSGINWARIMLLYPKYRTFEDGEADIFGNFTRARRSHWLMGVVFGPLDSKTFEEVDREIKSQGFYLDTNIIANAKDMDIPPSANPSTIDATADTTARLYVTPQSFH